VNGLPGHIKTLIFDLGGVIVDLSPAKTLAQFSELTTKTPDDILALTLRHPAFHAFEKGEVHEKKFRDAVREMLGTNADNKKIDHCWNAMLIKLPVEKLTMLNRLKKHFATLALSNTNSIHLRFINDRMLTSDSLNNYFDHAYYSHELGMRKPEAEIFQYVLNRHALNPSETLFMDDTLENIEAAKKLGIQTLLIQHPDEVLSLFSSYE
jgi:glucose-1-phosphatase